MSASPIKLRYLVSFSCALVLFLITFFSGPSVIWKAYQRTTSDKEKLEKRRRYQELANAEIGMDERSRLKSEEERTRLYYWFHARGWPIDEGHEGSSTLDHWRDLVRYWRSHEKRG